MWVQELPNGKYAYRERYKDPLTDKNKVVTVTLSSKSNQAHKKATQLLKEKVDDRLGSVSEKGDIRFREILDKWEVHYKKTVKNTSYITYEHTKSTLLDIVGKDTIIKNITDKTLRSMLETAYYEKEYSLNYTKKIKAIVILVLKYAKKNGYHCEVPKETTKLNIRKEPDAIKYLEPHELRLILDNCENKRVTNLLEFIALTGLRIGEALGLRLDNYDGKSITIDGTYNSKLGMRGTPKTKAAYRTISLSQRAIKILDNVIEENEEEQTLSERYINENYIFTGINGKPFSHSGIFYHLEKSLKKSGINRKITIHHFRHTHISMLAEKGVPLKAIMKRVGHKDPKITLEIYSHVTEKLEKEVLEKINEFEY